jgi:anti-anti-sigma regulatory factor
MVIETEEIRASVPVTILMVVGVLNATNYQDLTDKVRQIYQAGSRELIIDFSQLSFMSSSGILSLHDIAILMRGEPPADIREGGSAFHAISHSIQEETYYEKHVKLLNPQPRVRKTLEMTGFDRIIEIFNDRGAAIASFNASTEAS